MFQRACWTLNVINLLLFHEHPISYTFYPDDKHLQVIFKPYRKIMTLEYVVAY